MTFLKISEVADGSYGLNFCAQSPEVSLEGDKAPDFFLDLSGWNSFTTVRETQLLQTY